MEFEEEDLKCDRAMRFHGMHTFGAGLILGLIFICAPLQQAIDGEERVRMSYIGVTLALSAIMFGLIMMIFGRDSRHLIDFRDEDTTLLNLLTTVAVFAVAIGGAFGFIHYLKSFGYE